ncbi:ATP-binding protein [Bifidobacterium leontopitheci]|uniref:DNA-binding protein n=1 Tax=Bifidobacterium leontopitheci TaxID=2650774 RepID=A0A6I1GPC2_9BIFI|nr:ATP-binding protein [Bifidobacterium leontopitheci]KAB7791137.1 DNA-binding protein [Bifidobacterium leontopitheci]
MATAGNTPATGDDAPGFSQSSTTTGGLWEPAGRADLTFDHARQAFATAGVRWPLDAGGDNAADGTRPTFPLRRNGAFTRLALLISDQCPFSIKCAAFDGDAKASITDRAELHGSLLRQLNTAMAFLTDHNQPGDDGRQWPQAALREALVNAVLHRDYRYSGPTLVNVFASRVEIVSLGGLMPGLEINDLLNGICQPRNPALADLLAALGFSENYGTGIRRIMDEYERCADSPQIRVGAASVALVLPLPTPAEPRRKATTSDTAAADARTTQDGRTPGGHAKMYAFPAIVQSMTDDPAVALAGMRVIGCLPVMGGAADRSHPIVAPLRRQADEPAPAVRQDDGRSGLPVPPHSTQTLEEVTLHCIAQSGTPLSRRQIAEDLGMTKNQMTYVLRHLVERGLVLRQGRSRATRYSLP